MIVFRIAAMFKASIREIDGLATNVEVIVKIFGIEIGDLERKVIIDSGKLFVYITLECTYEQKFFARLHDGVGFSFANM